MSNTTAQHDVELDVRPARYLEATVAHQAKDGTTQRPAIEHQTLFECLRQLLPILEDEARNRLADPDQLRVAFELRHAVTHAPLSLFDGSNIVPEGSVQARLVSEAIFAYLIVQVTTEALHQTYGGSWRGECISGLVPELAAYAWFVPSVQLAHRVRGVVRSCRLSPIPVELAGELYESSLSQDERKAFGQYYTSVGIVRHLLDQAGYVASNPAILQPLFDVATGCGVFLAEATRRQLLALHERTASVSDICHVLQENLRGYDLHPFAIIATKIYVLAIVIDELSLSEMDVRRLLNELRLPGIRCGDTLDLTHRQTLHNEARWVVGNPPYGRCRQGVHLEPFRAVLKGRANLYQLFLYVALQACQPGGRIALLMPESLRSGEYFEQLRKELLAETALVGVTDFHTRTSIFPGVEQGVLVLVLEKHRARLMETSGAASDSCALVDAPQVSIVQAVDEEHLKRAEAFGVPASQAQLGARQHYILLRAENAESYELLARLWTQVEADQCIQLGVHTGRFVWNQHKQLLASVAGLAIEQRGWPILYAPSVHRYSFGFPPEHNNSKRRQFLYSPPAHDLKPLTASGKVLLAQRTTSRDQVLRLIATVVPETFSAQYPRYLIENHVNYIDIARIGDAHISLEFTLALLNSRLINFLFAAMSGTTHVSAAELRQLPLLYPGEVEAAHMEALVKERLRVQGATAQRLERDMDELIYTWYGLRGPERRQVDTYHARRRVSPDTRD